MRLFKVKHGKNAICLRFEGEFPVLRIVHKKGAEKRSAQEI